MISLLSYYLNEFSSTICHSYRTGIKTRRGRIKQQLCILMKTAKIITTIIIIIGYQCPSCMHTSIGCELFRIQWQQHLLQPIYREVSSMLRMLPVYLFCVPRHHIVVKWVCSLLLVYQDYQFHKIFVHQISPSL